MDCECLLLNIFMSVIQKQYPTLVKDVEQTLLTFRLNYIFFLPFLST